MDLVSIGNEIRNGILWPVGEVNCTGCGGRDNLAQLLKAGVAGAQAGNPAGHHLLIMMHYDQEPGANIGSPNVNLTLFNFEGAALPSVGIFQNPAGVCERYAPDRSPCTVG